MRRSEREVTDKNEILDILSRCNNIKIAMQGESYPYVVPVSFGMETEDGKAVVYFHCAREGLKVDYLKNNPSVCVEGDIFIKIKKTEHGITACYESVIGFGKCSFLKDESEIKHGLELLNAHYGYPDYPLDRCKGIDRLLVGKIILDEIYGKRNLPAS